MTISSDNTSLHIFRHYFRYSKDSNHIDASMVISKECYRRWLEGKRNMPSKPEEAFRRILTAHVRGSDGRKPFFEKEEESLLRELRKKRVWPCFAGTNSKIGINGFRAEGFHERKYQREEKQKTTQKNIRLPSLRSLSKTYTVTSQVKDTKCRTKYLSSYDVFQKFAPPDEGGNSRILSKECFETWVNTRRSGVKSPEHSFRKALIAHLCGKDGRRPFPIESERSIVRELRKKQVWPCFRDRTETSVINIGKKGFRHFGYHETLAQEQSRLAAQYNYSGSTRPKVNMQALVREQENRVPFLPRPKTSKFDIDLKNESDEAAAAKLLQYFSSQSTVNGAKRPNESVPESIPILKRKKYSLPSVFFNSTDAKNRLEQVLCYNSSVDSFSHHEQEELLQNNNGIRLVVAAPAQNPVLASTYQPINPFDSSGTFNTGHRPVYRANQDSVLREFRDVSSAEVQAVLRLKHLSLNLYKKHYRLYDREVDFGTVPLDVGGDVKLLRVLRSCKGNISQSITEIQDFLNWRHKYGLEAMRQDLVDKNMSFQQLKKEIDLGKRGGFYPFFAQDDNGDITDVHVLIPQLDQCESKMQQDLIDHIRIAEFRSIVLDKLSYMKKRVVMYKVLYDWTNVKQEDERIMNNGICCLGWMAALNSYGKFLCDLANVYTRWYCTTLSSCHVFGSGVMFKLFASTVTSAFFGRKISSITQFIGNQKGYEKVFSQYLGERSLWPTWMVGGKKNPENTELSKKQISYFK